MPLPLKKLSIRCDPEEWKMEPMNWQQKLETDTFVSHCEAVLGLDLWLVKWQSVDTAPGVCQGLAGQVIGCIPRGCPPLRSIIPAPCNDPPASKN